MLTTKPTILPITESHVCIYIHVYIRNIIQLGDEKVETVRNLRGKEKGHMNGKI